MWILPIIVVLAGLTRSSSAQTPFLEGPIPTLSVCQALTHPERYDGRMVRIRDQVVSSMEGAGFFGETCTGVFVTNGKVWPSYIAWTMPTGGPIVHKVDFTFDWQSSKAIDKKWRKLGKRYPGRCIAVTYTGMFESWSEATAKIVDSKGHEWRFEGFGHLNAAPAQLVLKSAVDVAPIPNCSKSR